MALPCDGDRILILKHNWLSLVVDGSKTMEIRGSKLKAGKCFFGWKSNIYASAILGEPIEIPDIQQWGNLRMQHRVLGNVLPYKKTYGLPIRNVERLEPPLSFCHPKGAIGIVKYKV